MAEGSVKLRVKAVGEISGLSGRGGGKR